MLIPFFSNFADKKKLLNKNLELEDLIRKNKFFNSGEKTCFFYHSAKKMYLLFYQAN